MNLAVSVLKHHNITSPDAVSLGLLTDTVNPLRYDAGWRADTPIDPIEVFGLLRSMMPEGVRVLDVGAGTGSGTLSVNSGKRNDVIAVEPDEDRSTLCRNRGIRTYTSLLDEVLAAHIGHVDVIVFSDVLEHLTNPGSMLQLSSSMLRPGGIVLASVPNVAHWSIRLALARGRFDYADTGLMDATHVRWFTGYSLRALFENAGYDVLEQRHTAGAWLPNYRAGLLRLLPNRLVRPLVKAGLQFAPSLFGCQLVIKATPRRST